MAQQLLRADLANTLKPSLDDYDKDQVTQVAAEAYMEVVEAWQLTDQLASEMLAVNPLTWMQIKNGTWNGSFSQEQLTRISAIIGLHNALHSYFGEKMADRWVNLNNTEPIFSGRKPIDAMVEGGLPMMIETRDYADALLRGW